MLTFVRLGNRGRTSLLYAPLPSQGVLMGVGGRGVGAQITLSLVISSMALFGL